MSLLERLQRDPEPWKPEPNDMVVGVVLDLAMREGGYGEYLVVAIETDDGREVDVHGYHTALRNEIMESDLHVGDRVGIRYIGKKDKVDGSGSYQAYRLVYERAERAAGSASADLPPATNDAPEVEPVAVPLLPDDDTF